MEISNAHHQVTMAMASLPLEEVLSGGSTVQQKQEGRMRPLREQALKCPRCESTNTKFCYYNNYSFSQPRYFCKGCRRYWTKGGSLRNVPVGGGCRNNKRSSSSSSSSSSSTTTLFSKRPPEKPLPRIIPPSLSYDPSDLTLPFARLHKQQHASGRLLDGPDSFLLGNPNPRHVGAAPTGPGFLDTIPTPNSFNNLSYQYGGNFSADEEVLLPFNGGLGGATTTAVTTVTTTTSQGSCKAMDEGNNSDNDEGLQWHVFSDGMDMEFVKDSPPERPTFHLDWFHRQLPHVEMK